MHRRSASQELGKLRPDELHRVELGRIARKVGHGKPRMRRDEFTDRLSGVDRRVVPNQYDGPADCPQKPLEEGDDLFARDRMAVALGDKSNPFAAGGDRQGSDDVDSGVVGDARPDNRRLAPG